MLKCTTARVLLRTLGPFGAHPAPAAALCLWLLHRDREQIANCFNYVAGKMPQHVACCVLNCWRTRRNFSFYCSAIVSCAVVGVLGAARVGWGYSSFCWCELQRTHINRKVLGARLLSWRNRPQCTIIYRTKAPRCGISLRSVIAF